MGTGGSDWRGRVGLALAKRSRGNAREPQTLDVPAGTHGGIPLRVGASVFAAGTASVVGEILAGKKGVAEAELGQIANAARI